MLKLNKEELDRFFNKMYSEVTPEQFDLTLEEFETAKDDAKKMIVKFYNDLLKLDRFGYDPQGRRKGATDKFIDERMPIAIKLLEEGETKKDISKLLHFSVKSLNRRLNSDTK